MNNRVSFPSYRTKFSNKRVFINFFTGSRDPNIVPAYKALETLIDDMPNIKGIAALIITGYPRNMRDVVEYMARVSQVTGLKHSMIAAMLAITTYLIEKQTFMFY